MRSLIVSSSHQHLKMADNYSQEKSLKCDFEELQEAICSEGEQLVGVAASPVDKTLIEWIAIIQR